MVGGIKLKETIKQLPRPAFKNAKILLCNYNILYFDVIQYLLQFIKYLFQYPITIFLFITVSMVFAPFFCGLHLKRS